MTRTGGGALRLAWEAWRFARGDDGAITRRQQERLKVLVTHARTASPYYRRLYRGLPPEVTDLQVLPPVHKRELMEQFDEWVTDPRISLAALRRDWLSDPSLVGARYLRRYHVATTSGASGDPAVLVHDAASWRLWYLVGQRGGLRFLARWDLVRGLLRDGLRVAALFAVGGHFGAQVALEDARRRSSHLARRSRMFSVLTPVAELVTQLNEFQPTVLEGYPSALALLAGEQREGRLRLRPFLAITSGEDLSAAMRSEIESSFGCPIENRYAATEVPGLAMQCPKGLFHVNVDWYLFEPVDESYHPVRPGETSYTVLVTNLANHVQPLIRYDLGDRVKVATAPCPCGNRLPAIIVEGRTGDLLEFGTAPGRVVSVVPLALGTVIEETAGVRRFQAIRIDATTLSVRLETWPDADADEVWREVDARLAAFFAAHGVDPIRVEHSPELPLADPRSGKFRQVWST